MAIIPVNRGSSPGDGTGDILYDAFGKINANEAELDGRVTTAQSTAETAQSTASSANSKADEVIAYAAHTTAFNNNNLNTIVRELYIKGADETTDIYLSSFKANGSNWYIEFSTWDSGSATSLIVKSSTLEASPYLFHQSGGIELFMIIDWTSIGDLFELDDVDYSEDLAVKKSSFNSSSSPTYSKVIPFNMLGQEGVYYGNGYSIGDTFPFKAPSSSASFYSIIFKLSKNESVDFTYIAYASASANIYIIDTNREVSAIITKTSPDVVERYTATEDCYVAFSTNRGSITYENTRPVDISNDLMSSDVVEKDGTGVTTEKAVYDFSGSFSQKSAFNNHNLNSVIKELYIKGADPLDDIYLSSFKANGSAWTIEISTWNGSSSTVLIVKSSTLTTSPYLFHQASGVDIFAVIDWSNIDNLIEIDGADYSEDLAVNKSAFESSFSPSYSKLIPFNMLGQEGVYYGNGYSIGDEIPAEAPSSSGAFYSIFFNLKKYETVNFNYIGYSSGSANIYIADLDRLVTAIIVKDSPDHIGSYTATEDCYVAFSTNRGAITYENTRPVDVSSVEEPVEDAEIIDIVIPKYLDCPIGRDTDIFLDHLIGMPDGVKTHSLTMIANSYAGIIERITPNQLRTIPVTETNVDLELRTHSISSLETVNNSKDLIFRCIPKDTGSGEDINICISGDSLIQDGWAVTEAYSLLTEDADYTLNQIGTYSGTKGGFNYSAEGRGGWSWEDYLNPTYESTPFQGKTNAFMSGGVLDFQDYMSTNFPLLTGIDIFIMSLGTNDITQGDSLPTDAKIAEIIADAKTFIDALLSPTTGYPSCKVVIGLPAVGALQFPNASLDQNLFKMGMLKLNRAYIDAFDDGTYHANVTTVMHGCFIERVNSYKHEDIAISDYVTETTRRYTDTVHPLQVGYEQWGRGYYNKIRAILNGDL